MPRRRKIELWNDLLPWEMEWALGLLFLAAWLGASIGYYWNVLSELERVVAAFAPLGVRPDEAAFRPLLDMALRLAPLAGLAIAFRAWRWTRRLLLRALMAGF